MDNRNFHGWSYRRKIVSALEIKFGKLDAAANSMTEEEFAYTTRMTEMSLSNFSAWHNRSKLILKLLNERAAAHEERKKYLNHELGLIQRALYADPDDASIWSYHQYLIGNLDPNFSSTSMVPDLTPQERLAYLHHEFENLRELQEEETDCKWIYQSLIQLARTLNVVSHEWPVDHFRVRLWIRELRRVDPLRIERWNDLERKLELSP
ncbi:Rab geranylgeranyltransferase [Pseudocyphellaria aurata]|nr:Rab geranylgeranyltransferase [Pseudocyphellaria aurata]